MLDDLRTITDYDYIVVLKRRAFTIRKRLRARIKLEDYPEHNDALLKEGRLLKQVGKLHNLRIE